jgi:hypothetical protein
MPDMRRDSHSGALVFDLTPTEKDVIDLKESYQDLSEKFEKLQEQVLNASSTTKSTTK